MKATLEHDEESGDFRLTIRDQEGRGRLGVTTPDIDAILRDIDLQEIPRWEVEWTSDAKRAYIAILRRRPLPVFTRESNEFDVGRHPEG